MWNEIIHRNMLYYICADRKKYKYFFIISVGRSQRSRNVLVEPLIASRTTTHPTTVVSDENAQKPKFDARARRGDAFL